DLLKHTQMALKLANEAAVVGNRIKDIGKAVSQYIEPLGFGIVHSYCGHGVGLQVHEDPQISNNYPSRGPNPRIRPGMVLALEPMINLGTSEVELQKDDWTVTTLDKSISVHFEHTIAITDNGTEILTIQ
ncbi:MAG: M24 family metallopeptidase, partial [Spirochaetaceae bacterium]|nr:M24 family metallopeptidase [Spirochaetaceae bacterium]